MEKKINLKAKNIWILLIIISLIIWAYFLFSNINRDKNLNHLLNNTWVSEEDKADLISDLDENKSISKEEIDKKIDNLKRKIKFCLIGGETFFFWSMECQSFISNSKRAESPYIKPLPKSKNITKKECLQGSFPWYRSL